MNRLAYKVLRSFGIALMAFALVRLSIANPGPTPDLLLPIAEKQCTAALNMRCKVVFE
ncbi:hypothetical protein D3C71_1216430 [compost metagenome]